MFSRKKKPPPAKPKSKSHAGLDFDLGIPGFNQNQQEDDSELEAELLALTGGKKSKVIEDDFSTGNDDEDLEAELARLVGGSSSRRKPPPISAPGSSLQKLKESIDFGSDEDVDVDENDPELLGELQMLTTDETEDVGPEVEPEQEEDEEEEISQLDLIKSRLEMYKTAEAKAKASNESSRARRFNRGTKTLEKLLKRAQGGEIVPYDEIPPEIATNLKPAPPVTIPTQPEVVPEQSEIVPEQPDTSYHLQPEPILAEEALPEEDQLIDATEVVVEEPVPELPKQPSLPRPQQQEQQQPRPSVNEAIEDPPLLKLLKTRRDEFKKAALTAKQTGNMPLALEKVRNLKICDKLINNFNAGMTISEQEIPPSAIEKPKPQKMAEPMQKSIDPAVPFVISEVFSTPRTVKEALDQRLDYFTKALSKAEAMGLRNDVRKLGSIVKIYQNAVRMHEKGSKVPYEKLPTPPGCPPIPLSFNI